MTRLFYSLTLVFAFGGWLTPAAHGEAKQIFDRDILGQRVEKACARKVNEEEGELVDETAVCSCISKRLLESLTDDELELITRSYEEDERAEKQLQEKEKNELVLKDYDIVQDCMRK